MMMMMIQVPPIRRSDILEEKEEVLRRSSPPRQSSHFSTPDSTEPHWQRGTERNLRVLWPTSTSYSRLRAAGGRAEPPSALPGSGAQQSFRSRGKSSGLLPKKHETEEETKLARCHWHSWNNSRRHRASARAQSRPRGTSETRHRRQPEV
ncbi:hypothetical protein Mapa_013447 [Marchantia paleacea]|nr:hypothetical protein Mapa_013447 [Marchantia paleacea]